MFRGLYNKTDSTGIATRLSLQLDKIYMHIILHHTQAKEKSPMGPPSIHLNLSVTLPRPANFTELSFGRPATLFKRTLVVNFRKQSAVG